MIDKIQRYTQSLPTRSRYYLRLMLIIALFLGFTVVSFLINLQHIEKHTVGDTFLTNWISIKLFLAEGTDPYSSETRDVVNQYASAVLQREPVPETVVFNMPLFVVIFYLPFLFFDSFSHAYALWMTLIEGVLLGISFLSYHLVKPKIRMGWVLFLGALVSVAFSYYAYMILQSGSAFPITILFLMLGVWAVKKQADELAGVFFGFASINIHAIWLVLLFIIIWSIRMKRPRLAGWMVGTILLLGIASALVQPDWLLYYGRGMVRFGSQTSTSFLPSVLSAYYPGTFRRLGTVLMIAAGALLFSEWFIPRKQHFAAFYWTLLLTFVISQFFILWFEVEQLLLLTPVIGFVLILWVDRWKQKGFVVASIVMGGTYLLPWLVMSVQGLSNAQARFWLIVPLTFFLLANLYWVRWWLFRNTELWFEEAYLFDNPAKRDTLE